MLEASRGSVPCGDRPRAKGSTVYAHLVEVPPHATRRATVRRLPGGAQASDRVAVEEPLEIRVDGTAVAVTMRTPGADIDLIHGLLHSEGVIAERGDISLARYCAGSGPDGVNTYNVLDVSLARHVEPPRADQRRQVLTTSACGLCGATSINSVLRDSRYPLDRELRVSTELILAGPSLLREQFRAASTFPFRRGGDGGAVVEAQRVRVVLAVDAHGRGRRLERGRRDTDGLQHRGTRCHHDDGRRRHSGDGE